MQKERAEMGAWPKFDVKSGSAFLVFLGFFLIIFGVVAGAIALKDAPQGYGAQMLWTGVMMGVSPGGTLIGIGLFIRVMNDISVSIRDYMLRK